MTLRDAEIHNESLILSMENFQGVGASLVWEFTSREFWVSTCLWKRNYLNRSHWHIEYIQRLSPRGVFYFTLKSQKLPVLPTVSGIKKWSISARCGQKKNYRSPCTHQKTHNNWVGRFYGNQHIVGAFCGVSSLDSWSSSARAQSAESHGRGGFQ
jgi:hypothetical protein